MDQVLSDAPGLDDSKARLTRLIELWNDSEPAEFPAVDGTALRGMSLYAHVDHGVRLARAVLVMAERDLFVELIPLVRMLLECSVTAAWYAVTPGSGDSSLHEATRQRRALVEAVGLASGAQTEEVLADLDDALEELDEFRSAEAKQFEQRCLSLEGGDWLYVEYRGLSSFSHAGAGLLDYYLQEDDNPLHFSYVTEPDADRARSHLSTAVWMLHIALSAWSVLSPSGKRAAVLDEIAKECGFQVVIRRR